jgi:hypothetical protein
MCYYYRLIFRLDRDLSLQIFLPKNKNPLVVTTLQMPVLSEDQY